MVTHRKAPSTRPKIHDWHVRTTLPASWPEVERRPSLLKLPWLVWRGRVLFHNKSNTLRQQQQRLGDVLVQVPPNNCVSVMWRMAMVAVPLGHVFLVLLFSIFSPQPSFFLYWTCDSVSPVSGLSGSAWHWAFRERTAPEDSRAAVRASSSMCRASGGVRHKFQNSMQWESSKITTLSQSEHQEIIIFVPQLLRNCLY